MRVTTTICAVCLLALTTGCGRADKLGKDQVESAMAASAALHNLAAIAIAGPSADTYVRAVDDAVTAVDPALRTLPDGPVRTRLTAAQARFSDARLAWGRLLADQSAGFVISATSPFGRALRLRMCDTHGIWASRDDGEESIGTRTAIRYMINEGAALVEEADSALASEGRRTPHISPDSVAARNRKNAEPSSF